ncbi:LacI family DNA-binding transcriptional regulator [Paenibacillus sp. S150]|uniref:LacI family DNA-binding transcriptional regulator n=1 Tax=Paenibacillus sp. S150 TaxID=2749826 RepID=UPI001C599AC8|nr:LacI family DNA-binding transcriptional regulator [Paenibacillus sp. S150]MBW4080919.1 LacI family DNA-binding transcriptional regulator [Paenibacillus sp. S150]
MKVTITDIAAAAGVAKSTVSKVLNDSPKISQETKLRVREIMKRMNYTPSSIATGLARQSSSNIGLLIDMSKSSEFLNQFFYSIIGGIESIIGSLKYELTIANVQHNYPEGHFLHRLVMSKRVDGLIANTSVLTEELCMELNRLQFPYISLGEVAAAGCWVDFDNEAGGRMLTRHLLEEGYSAVAFIGGQEGDPLFIRRLNGCRQVLQQAGLPLLKERIIHGEAEEAEGCRAAKELLLGEAPPDSMICMSNFTAFGVLQAAKELGVQVPAELGIATFDEYPLSRYTTPPLTSLNLDTFHLGVSAGQLLMERIIDRNERGQGLLLEPELIPRESTFRTKKL